MNTLLRSKLISSILLPAAVILMEIFSLYPWLIWFGKAILPSRQGALLSFISCLLLLSVTYLVTRYFLRLKWDISLIQLNIILCLLCTIFIILRIEYSYGFGFWDGQWFTYIGGQLFSNISTVFPLIIALLMSIYIVWRGMRRGRSLFYFSNIYRSFLIGLVASIFLLIIVGVRSPFDSFEQVLSNIGINVACFFFFGLLAMALTNLQSIQEKMAEKEGAATAFSRRWLYIIIGIVALIILVGIFSTSLLSPEILVYWDKIAGIVGELLLTALYYILLPAGYVIGFLVYVLRFLISLLGRGELLQQPPDASNLQEQQKQIMESFPPEIIVILKWLLVLLAVALVIFLLIKAISRQLSQRIKDEIEETSESVWNWQEFNADARLFIAGILNRFKPGRNKQDLADKVPAWFWDDTGMLRLGIREIYQSLLWNAAHRGLGWQKGETPYEYAKRFGRLLPEADRQINDLTEIYINVRYGDIKAEEKQIDDANSLWSSIKKSLTDFDSA